MTPTVLCHVAPNCFGRRVLHHPLRGRWGSERRPHLSDDGGVEDTTNRKEVSDGSLYHTPAPVPDPSVASTTGTPTRTGPRRHPPRGHRRTDPPGGGRHLEGDPLHPLPDLLGLLLAGPQPPGPAHTNI